MSLVAATKTVARPQTVADALVNAWDLQLGSEPTLLPICVLLAQWALETAEGASCICWNIGNFKRPDPAAGDYCEFATTEYVNGVAERISPPNPGCRFAAYASLDAGVSAYLHSMWSHWTKAWPYVVAADPENFARGLRAQGYYTAPVAEYAAGVRRYFDRYRQVIQITGTPTKPD